MNVEILAGDALIGTGELDQLDPPMGVAFGPFLPTPSYDRALHAGEIEGQRNEMGASTPLSVRGPRGEVQCEGVWIADFHDALGEIQVSVLGISDFEAYFGDHPHFREYYGLS